MPKPIGGLAQIYRRAPDHAADKYVLQYPTPGDHTARLPPIVTNHDLGETSLERSRVRFFLAVCQHGSFSAAAQACGVSQPAVSSGVARLERSIGAKLIQHRNPVKLSPFGNELLPFLKTLHSTAEAIEILVKRHSIKVTAAEKGAIRPIGRPNRARRAARRS